jgi:hypothetical protein
MKVRTRNEITSVFIGTNDLREKKSGIKQVSIARETKKNPSPNRFIMRVNKPDRIDLEFW